MKTQGLDVFYDSDFEQFLAEDHDAATLKKDTDDALRTYCSMFHEPFFITPPTQLLQSMMGSPRCEKGSHAYEIGNALLRKTKATDADNEPPETVVRD